MIERAPPSAEPISHSVSAPNLVMNADRLTPASQQINAMETSLGIANHSGLSWESDGKLYVVRGQGVERKAVIDPHTGEYITSTRKVGPIIPKRSGLTGRGRREVHETETELVNTLYIDVYEGDEPLKDKFVKVEPMSEAEFDGHIDAVVKKDSFMQPRPLLPFKFWWQEQRAESVRGNDRIDVYVPAGITPKEDKDKNGKTVADYVRETQQAYRLNDWSGLTYTASNGKLELEQSEILRDVTMSVRTVDGWVKERYFEIQKSNNDGPIRRSMVPASQIQNMLKGADRNTLDIHFRVDKTELDERERLRLLGKQALNAFVNGNLYAGPGMPLDEDQATDLLSGIDVYSGAELAERRSWVETRLPLYVESALALVEMSKEFGTLRLLDLAKRVKSNYAADAKKIGLPPEDDSIDWVLFELGKQYHFARNPDEVRPDYIKYAGIEDGSPLGYDSWHRHKQQELIDQHAGKRFANWLVIVHPQGPKEVYIRQPDGSYIPKVKQQYVIERNTKLMKDLKITGAKDITVKNRLNAILDKITPDDTVLSYKDQVEIGRLLRSVFAH
jgi:hypothetical protein